MENSTEHTIADFSPHLFWDVDPSKLELERSAAFIIERVLEYGLMKDWKLIMEIYGMEKIKEVSLKSKYLSPKTHSFVATIFNLPKNAFRCYELRQLNKEHWIY